MLCIIPTGVLGGTPTTKCKCIQLHSLLLLLSQILMVLLHWKLKPSKPTLVLCVIITNMQMWQSPLLSLLLVLLLCKLCPKALSNTLTHAHQKCVHIRESVASVHICVHIWITLQQQQLGQWGLLHSLLLFLSLDFIDIGRLVRELVVEKRGLARGGSQSLS